MKKLVLTGFLWLLLLASFSQETNSFDKIANKAVILFPEITLTQLNNLKPIFLKYDQIASAKYVFGNCNCMLLTFKNQVNEFTVYDEFLKIIIPVYDTKNCLFKSKESFTEIETNSPQNTIFNIK